MEAERRMQTTLRRLHDELIEKVILNAQSGDREGTEAAMDLAEESGVPATTLQMLEGIAHYYDGDNVSAIRVLEKVVELEPHNVTARAMLALSYGHNGRWVRYFREILQAQEEAKATERNDYESLILGCALMYLDTVRCVEMLQETVNRHPEWIVARAMLAGAKGHRAIELPNADLAREALKETKLAADLLPDNRVVALYNVWTHRVAIYFAQLENRDYEDIRHDAEASIQVLMKKHADYNTAGAYNVATFYEVIGEDDKAMEVFSNSIGNADHDGWTYYYVGLLVRRGRLDDALELLDAIRIDSVGARYAKANLVAVIPERREEAKRIYDSFVDELDFAYAGTSAVEILCLLGDSAKVQSESRRTLGLLSKHDVTAWLPVKSLEFHAGQAIEQFDEACGEAPIERMEFHYQVAMRKLAEGDRESAIRHFDECAKSVITDSWCCTWARAFRRLLEDHPNWPGT